MIYGYARVSTAFEQGKDRNQTFDRQIKILTEYGVKEKDIFCDRISGGKSTTNREEYNKLMETVMSGDTIVVSEMSRFSRSLIDLVMSIDDLIKKQIGIIFIKENIKVGTTKMTPMDKLTIQLMGAFAEFERSLIGNRVHEGMQASKAKGTVLGRPKKRNEELDNQIIDKYFNCGWNYQKLADYYGLSVGTISHICKKHREIYIESKD